MPPIRDRASTTAGQVLLWVAFVRVLGVLAIRSRQKKYGGGKFKSEKQRRYMWATRPKAAKKWAHNKRTRKCDWRRR